MYVSAQPDVEGQVIADVVRVVINHYLVVVPIPVGAIAIIVGSYTEKETAEPEAFAAPTTQVPHVPRADSAGKVTMLPRVVEMIVGIGGAGFMSDPLSVIVNVRSVRVSLRITIIACLCRRTP